MKLTRSKIRSLIKEELQLLRESANGMPYRARIMLGLVPGVEVLGGSLGHGLPVAVGMALGLQREKGRHH